jgi:hypothetical protein
MVAESNDAELMCLSNLYDRESRMVLARPVVAAPA